MFFVSHYGAIIGQMCQVATFGLRMVHFRFFCFLKDFIWQSLMLRYGSKELNEIYRLASSECDLVSFGRTPIFLETRVGENVKSGVVKEHNDSTRVILLKPV
jgi:hypothetical protein